MTQVDVNFQGCLCRQFKSEPLTHSAIAFELEGGWRDTKKAVEATVLQFLLGGGGSFSSGGPGIKASSHFATLGPASQVSGILLEGGEP